MRWPFVWRTEYESLVRESNDVRAASDQYARSGYAAIEREKQTAKDLSVIRQDRDCWKQQWVKSGEECVSLRDRLADVQKALDETRTQLRYARLALRKAKEAEDTAMYRLSEMTGTLKHERERTTAIENRYHDLVKTSLTPMPARVDSPEPDFEQRARQDISNETIQRATQDLIHAGMDAKEAAAEARRLFTAVDGVADEAGLMVFAEEPA